MKHNLKLTMLIEKGDQDWFVGQIEEIPGVLTQGKTIDETKENLLDALDLYLAAQREDRALDRVKGQIFREELAIG
jgi:predicted RNase H-like HicB family nuclease